MSKERTIQLLRNLIDYVAIAANTSEQIEQLANIGFTEDELIFFGYSRQDINEYYNSL